MAEEKQLATSKIDWSSDQVSFFWDWMSENSPDYFTEHAGRGILSKAKQLLPESTKKVLDFGSGPGFLTKLLAEEFDEVFALDYSQESLQKLKKRVPNVSQVFLYSNSAQYESVKVDAVFLIETIEHLDPMMKKEVLTKIKKLLSPGGKLFVSCPNEEDLRSNTICCPSCKTEFHRMQHVSSYSLNTLSAELEEFGFTIQTAGVTNFKYGKFGQKIRELSSPISGRKLPHLYAFASV
jgi:2-polyprenyl-3-methyl-5-hydroxy-6-metoxy-1,4-benzoquinol methylase